MIKHKKVNLISALLLVLVVSICGAIFSIAPAKTHAEEIDYRTLYYQDLTFRIDALKENVIYKIHCPILESSCLMMQGRKSLGFHLEHLQALKFVFLRVLRIPLRMLRRVGADLQHCSITITRFYNMTRIIKMCISNLKTYQL